MAKRTENLHRKIQMFWLVREIYPRADHRRMPSLATAEKDLAELAGALLQDRPEEFGVGDE